MFQRQGHTMRKYDVCLHSTVGTEELNLPLHSLVADVRTGISSHSPAEPEPMEHSTSFWPAQQVPHALGF